MEDRFLPNNYHEFPFLIIPNFFSAGECDAIVQEIKESACTHQGMVKTMLLDSVVAPSVDKKIRKTCIYSLSDKHEERYRERFISYQHEIERFFYRGLTTATSTQVLEYQKGDFYIKHADDSNEIINKKGETVGFKCVAPQRKFSTVLFLTSHELATQVGDETFSGGELLFNYLYDDKGNQISIRPKVGDMIVFPSNPYFSHEVKEVIEGYRVTLVQWHNAIA